ncbi:MAG: peptide deformylase, partial [Candidatus Liptonbacteria bacterium]|nr:peptide deformylase [Candidatus Liptonbacteria bacterium]
MDHIWKLENKSEEKLLRKKAEPFDFKSMSKAEIQKLVAAMRKKMREANGVGLAANQVGLPFSMFVAEVPDEKNGGKKFYAIMNPVIEKTGKETPAVEEGCLSVPGKYGEVSRPQRVTLTG